MTSLLFEFSIKDYDWILERVKAMFMSSSKPFLARGMKQNLTELYGYNLANIQL